MKSSRIIVSLLIASLLLFVISGVALAQPVIQSISYDPFNDICSGVIYDSSSTPNLVNISVLFNNSFDYGAAVYYSNTPYNWVANNNNLIFSFYTGMPVQFQSVALNWLDKYNIDTWGQSQIITWPNFWIGSSYLDLTPVVDDILATLRLNIVLILIVLSILIAVPLVIKLLRKLIN